MVTNALVFFVKDHVIILEGCTVSFWGKEHCGKIYFFLSDLFL